MKRCIICDSTDVGSYYDEVGLPNKISEWYEDNGKQYCSVCYESIVDTFVSFQYKNQKKEDV